MRRRWDLAELVQAHQAGIWRFLRFLGCDEPQADDLTQETFLAVVKRPFDDRGPEATRSYLRMVARNLFLLSLRRRKSNPVTAHLEPVDLELADAVWVQFTRDDDGEAYRTAMNECVQSLEGRARVAIDLFYRDDASRADVARQMEMSEDGVKSLLRRTREVLRRCVEKRIEREAVD